MQATMSTETIMTHLRDMMPAMRISMSLCGLLPGLSSIVSKEEAYRVLGSGFFSCLGAVQDMSRSQKPLD